MFTSEPETVPNTVEKMEVAQEVADCKMKECNPFLDSQMQNHRNGCCLFLIYSSTGTDLQQLDREHHFLDKRKFIFYTCRGEELNTLNMTAWKPQLFCPPRQISNKSDNNSTPLVLILY